MRFKIDENLPQEVAGFLRDAGHDAMTALDQGLSGAQDQRIFDVCVTEGRTLVTLDLDFSDIRAYPPQNTPGIVILRLKRHDKRGVMKRVGEILPLFKKESIKTTCGSLRKAACGFAATYKNHPKPCVC